MSTVILTTIKKMIGFDADYTVFDVDLIIQINSCFSTLHQLGVGPEDGFAITGDSELWSQYTGVSSAYLEMVKNYIYLKTKLTFDRPDTSFAITSMENLIKELEWRLKVQKDDEVNNV